VRTEKKALKSIMGRRAQTPADKSAGYVTAPDKSGFVRALASYRDKSPIFRAMLRSTGICFVGAWHVSE
jgi:hypothetical protein